MKKRFGPIVLLAGALFLLAAQFSIAQSVDVKGRGNALRVLGYSLFDENEGFGGTGAGLAYGIAGHLDIGFDAGMRFGEIEGEDAEESRLTFHFRGLLARQTEGFPITSGNFQRRARPAMNAERFFCVEKTVPIAQAFQHLQ